MSGAERSEGRLWYGDCVVLNEKERYEEMRLKHYCVFHGLWERVLQMLAMKEGFWFLGVAIFFRGSDLAQDSH